jgi:hypothetical protein
VRSIPPADFLRDVLDAAKHNRDCENTITSWGSLAVWRLPLCDNISATRLYSPDFLQAAFCWSPSQSDWDGIICEVEPPSDIIVQKFRAPFCLKWRSESEEALNKKARGVTSLWADAVRQIPDGEIGFIYIAYPEGARSVIADARTQYILDYMRNKSWYRWSVRVPATVITRLYARVVGPGCPDLIENSLPGADKGQEFWLASLPWRILPSDVGFPCVRMAGRRAGNAIAALFVRITIRYNYSLDLIPDSCILTVFLHLAAEKRQGVPCSPKSLARFSHDLFLSVSASSALSVVKIPSSKGDPK